MQGSQASEFLFSTCEQRENLKAQIRPPGAKCQDELHRSPGLPSLARRPVLVGHGDEVGRTQGKRVSVFDRETEENAKIGFLFGGF